ncbi:MAG TPA: hypothetical protein VLV17_09140 [Anaeromyxobacteraceae bacterium]|nr:hypothetical protein [Anaeromyxobacteraceae bacterium]
MAARDSARRIHLASGLIILGVFLAGALAGAGVLAFMRPAHSPFWPPPAERLPPPLSELHLSPEQRTKAQAIAEKYRPELEAVLAASFPRIREVEEKMDREMRGLLTEAQAKEFDALRARAPPGRGPRPPGPPGLGPPPPGGPPPFGPPR